MEECGHSLRIGDLFPRPNDGLLGHQERGREDVGFPFGTADIVPRSVWILYGAEIVLGIDEFSFTCSEMKDKVAQFVSDCEPLPNRPVVDIEVYSGVGRPRCDQSMKYIVVEGINL